MSIYRGLACVFASFFFVLVVGGVANADPLLLFNTGVLTQDPLVLLPEGSVDPHYTIITAPAGEASPGIPIVQITAPSWIPQGPNSKWIVPPPGGDRAAGSYTYRTTFAILPGFDPLTASISGQWSTDNNGLNILINGTSTGHTTSFTQFAEGFAPFSITSGFVLGLNNLDFVVNNGSGPTGLRVEFLTATVEPGDDLRVPEPGSLLLMAMGLGSLAFSRRRAALH